MIHDEDFLERARGCFREAAEGTNPHNMRLLVELGIEYLRLALNNAAVIGQPPGDDADWRLH